MNLVSNNSSFNVNCARSTVLRSSIFSPRHQSLGSDSIVSIYSQDERYCVHEDIQDFLQGSFVHFFAQPIAIIFEFYTSLAYQILAEVQRIRKKQQEAEKAKRKKEEERLTVAVPREHQSIWALPQERHDTSTHDDNDTKCSTTQVPTSCSHTPVHTKSQKKLNSELALLAYLILHQLTPTMEQDLVMHNHIVDRTLQLQLQNFCTWAKEECWAFCQPETLSHENYRNPFELKREQAREKKEKHCDIFQTYDCRLQTKEETCCNLAKLIGSFVFKRYSCWGRTGRIQNPVREAIKAELLVRNQPRKVKFNLEAVEIFHFYKDINETYPIKTY